MSFGALRKDQLIEKIIYCMLIGKKRHLYISAVSLSRQLRNLLLSFTFLVDIWTDGIKEKLTTPPHRCKNKALNPQIISIHPTSPPKKDNILEGCKYFHCTN